MKLNRLETHDRLQQFHKEQSLNIFQGADDCMKRNNLSLALQDRCPYVYLFAHPRTSDDGVTKRMIWQPRLTKPSPQTNSYLFRGTSHTDIIEVCWLLPPREMWSQYKRGLVTENELVLWSITQFTTKRDDLAAPHPDDLPDEQIRNIYLAVAKEQDETMSLFDKFQMTHADFTK